MKPEKSNQGILPRFITKTIDFFYFPVLKKVMPLQTFRYAFCGGINLVLGWFLFYIVYHFVFNERLLDLGFYVLSPHVATLAVVYILNVMTGFYLNKKVAFKHSPLRNRTQLFRYVVSTIGALAINTFFLKMLVDGFGFYPTPSQIASTMVTTIYSYLMAKYFTFRGCVEI